MLHDHKVVGPHLPDPNCRVDQIVADYHTSSHPRLTYENSYSYPQSLRPPLFTTMTGAGRIQFLGLPEEIRFQIYTHLFANFTLDLPDGGHLVPYECDPDLAVNQICKVNQKVREESIPVLAKSVKVICATILLPTKDGVITDGKGQVVTPKMKDSFMASVQGLSIALQSAWVPDYTNFPKLQRIVVDTWFTRHTVHRKKKDTDLVAHVDRAMRDDSSSDDVYPSWLKELYKDVPKGASLGIQQVWRIEATDSMKSHLKALVNLGGMKVEHREEGSNAQEQTDKVPPMWLYQ